MLESKILIFVRREMNFDLHIGLKTEKAACAFLHLASTVFLCAASGGDKASKVCEGCYLFQAVSCTADGTRVCQGLWFWLHLP